MKFHDLLTHRDALLQAARLANVAYACQWLGNFAARVEHAGLRGEVTLSNATADGQRHKPELFARDFSQSVVEEHFLEEEIAELADVLAFVHDAVLILDLKFRLEDVAARFLPELRHELEEAGVLPPAQPAPSVENPDSSLDAA